jgi:hypothetical protein
LSGRSPQQRAVVRSGRPGRVVEIEGVVFQCDADDTLSGLLIRPLQELSHRLRGRPGRASLGVPLATHAGIRVQIAAPNGKVRRYVVEQLNGTLLQNVANGLSWTPWRDFKSREGGGWDVTVPAVAFDGVELEDVRAAVENLNQELGQPFYREVCTAFIERVFDGKRLFEHVELVDRLVPGPGPRIPEPAAPLFKPDAKLSRRARHLLRVDELTVVRADVDQAKASGWPPHSGLSFRDVGRRLNEDWLRPARVWYWVLAQIERMWILRSPRRN